jgi:hypothetical protein
MQQILLEKKNVLPKNIFEVHKLIGCTNYKFNSTNIHINHYEDICLIAKLLNGNDFEYEINDDFVLYYPYFEWNFFSERFVFHGCEGIYKNEYFGFTNLGFKTKELAEYAGKTFEKEYNKWFTSEYDSKLIKKVGYKDVKNMSDVYKVNGIKELTTYPETKERYYEDLILISKALNGKWKSNFKSRENNKYYPTFFYSNSRINYSNTDCNYMHLVSSRGPYLYFKNRELAEYAGKIFLKQYKKII